MKCYIKKDQVSESIEYFKNAGFDTDDMLFLFLNVWSITVQMKRT